MVFDDRRLLPYVEDEGRTRRRATVPDLPGQARLRAWTATRRPADAQEGRDAMTDRLEVEAEALEQVCAAAGAMLRRIAAQGAADRDEASAEFTARIEALRRELEHQYALGAHEADVVVSTALARALSAAAGHPSRDDVPVGDRRS